MNRIGTTDFVFVVMPDEPGEVDVFESMDDAQRFADVHGGTVDEQPLFLAHDKATEAYIGEAERAHHQGAAPEYPFDSGKQLALDTLADRGIADRAEIMERIATYEREHGGDLWLDFFGPLMDRIEDALGYERGE